MRVCKHISLLVLLLLGAGHSFAQVSKLEKALELYREKQLDSARVYIDSAAVNAQTRNEYNVWMVRGFVYKDLYRSKESAKPISAYRHVAVESFKQALALDTFAKGSQREGIVQSLKFLASTYHNDINKTLDTVNYQVSLDNAANYAKLTKFLTPDFNDKAYHYDVYLTVGSMFEKEYERSSTKFTLDLAKAYLFKAHDIDSSSFLVNKDLGLLYYNQAVEIIRKMDVDVSLEELPVYQDRSVKLAKQALPYLLKAHNMNNQDKVVIEGLMGVYYLLNEMELYNQFKKKSEELRDK